METLETLKRRMDTAESLRDLVRTMKTLAVVSIRRYERSVAALTDYSQTVELGLRASLHHAGVSAAPQWQRARRARGLDGREGALVFGSDHGLCGTFNEQIVTRVREDLDAGRPQRERLRLYAVGTRVGTRLAESGLTPEGEAALPLSPSLLSGLVQDLLLVIDHWRADGDLDGVLLYFNHPVGSTATQAHRSTLLPITPEWLERLSAEPWPTRALPLHTIDLPELLGALTRQYLFVELHRALAFSLMAEHTNRLMAMQAAEHNIGERLEELRDRYHSERQTAITAELLDIVSGTEALVQDAA